MIRLIVWRISKGAQLVGEQLIRVGTKYIPVKDVNLTSDWYVNNLEEQLNYIDEDKEIINLALIKEKFKAFVLRTFFVISLVHLILR